MELPLPSGSPIQCMGSVFMSEFSSAVWWWSCPNICWLPKILHHIKKQNSSEKEIIMLHCDYISGIDKSISLTNYFFNIYLTLNSLGEHRTVFLNLKDMVSSIELFLTRERNKDVLCEKITDEEIIQFYDKYVSSFDESIEKDDSSFATFKAFLQCNNCIDGMLLLDFCLKHDLDELSHHTKDKTYLILGSPTFSALKKFISILGGQKICSISVETPLDVSLHGSPSTQTSDKIEIVDELIEVNDVLVNSECSLEFGSATEEYVEDIIRSFLSLLVNSKNELALSKVMISPLVNLSHEAFTALKHLAVEKEMPLCQVAVSYVTRVRLGGKGYAPPKDCPMLPHLKGLELFVDILNQMQTVVEEDPCPRSAVRRLINILKKRLLKCGSEKLKESSVEAAVESLQNTFVANYEILKLRVSSNASLICQGTFDILYHFINLLSCNSFVGSVDVILSKKKAKRTPLNLPPLLGYFRSPEEESSCDRKLTLNEDSVLSRNSESKTANSISYFHHSESSEASISRINSTPSKTTFRGCLNGEGETCESGSKVNLEICSENLNSSVVPKKKSRKRNILGEITNENIIVKEIKETCFKSTPAKISKTLKTNAVQSNNKKTSKKEPKGSAKKFKQIQGQGKITTFFLNKG